MTGFEDGRMPEVLSEDSRQRRESRRRRRQRQFIRGPIPMSWMEQAAKLPGKTLAVAMLLRFMKGIMRDKPIKLSASLLHRFGVGRKAAARALGSLERAGLIRAERGQGRLARVQIVDQAPPEDSQLVHPSSDNKDAEPDEVNDGLGCPEKFEPQIH